MINGTLLYIMMTGLEPKNFSQLVGILVTSRKYGRAWNENPFDQGTTWEVVMEIQDCRTGIMEGGDSRKTWSHGRGMEV